MTKIGFENTQFSFNNIVIIHILRKGIKFVEYSKLFEKKYEYKVEREI